ncbi:MAG TPA: transposase [Solirubrobacteraceae bacterium]|nr:transposase [Solirubrobacteraceae bacterium]
MSGDLIDVEWSAPEGRRLSAEEKWRVFLEVSSRQLSQADAARRRGVEVSTVIELRRLARDGALAAFAASGPGRAPSIEQVEIEKLRAENARLSEALKALAVELSPLRGRQRSGFRPGPARVSAGTRLELPGLVDRALAAGWPQLRACRVLDLADVRAHGWRARLRETASLEDRRPVADAVHRLVEWEARAILELIEEWAPVDRSHRKLAHRGSHTGRVFVSPSTPPRIAPKPEVRLPEDSVRIPAAAPGAARGSRGSQTGTGWGTARTSPGPGRSPRRSSTSSPATGSAARCRHSSPPPRRSCCSPARWRTRACSTTTACHHAGRTGWRPSSRCRTTPPR